MYLNSGLGDERRIGVQIQGEPKPLFTLPLYPLSQLIYTVQINRWSGAARQEKSQLSKSSRPKFSLTILDLEILGVDRIFEAERSIMAMADFNHFLDYWMFQFLSSSFDLTLYFTWKRMSTSKALSATQNQK